MIRFSSLVLATSLIVSGSAGLARSGGKQEHFDVTNAVAELPNSPASQYINFHFDVSPRSGASLKDVVADVVVMAPDRTVVGQNGSSHPTESAHKLHFDVGAILYKTGCPHPLYPQQLIVLSRYAEILEVVVVRPMVIPSPQPGGCV